MWLLNLKNTLPFIKKKPHSKILREKPKEQHLYLNLAPLYIYIYIRLGIPMSQVNDNVPLPMGMQILIHA